MTAQKAVISASRRTDLPRMFPHLLAKWIDDGYVFVSNPYNHVMKKVLLDPKKVHTIVFWSKDYSAFIKNQYQLWEKLERYHQLFFHLTITGLGGSELEPGIKNWETIVQQAVPLIALAKKVENVVWRFDPIIFWEQDGVINSNVGFFEVILEKIRQAGIRKVVFSFFQEYKSALNRALKKGLRLISISDNQKIEIASRLAKICQEQGLKLSACCEPITIPLGITKSKCIDGLILNDSYHETGPTSISKDRGQRKDCNCTESIDIGNYYLSCQNGCLYCYARPK